MQYRVVRSHRSHYPEPVAFAAGEPLVLGRGDDEYPGWVWVTAASGRSGWAPESYLERRGGDAGVGRVAYDARELDVEVGDAVEALVEESGWMLVRDRTGVFGWVPVANLHRE